MNIIDNIIDFEMVRVSHAVNSCNWLLIARPHIDGIAVMMNLKSTALTDNQFLKILSSLNTEFFKYWAGLDIVQHFKKSITEQLTTLAAILVTTCKAFAIPPLQLIVNRAINNLTERYYEHAQ